MRLFSKIILFLTICPIAWVQAQSTTGAFSGDWEFDSDTRFRFENGKVLMLEKNKKGDYEPYKWDSPFQPQQSSLINRNNAQYTWINTCKECGWTETQSYFFSYINKYLMRVLKVRVVNNIGGLTNPIDSWHADKPKSFIADDQYDLVPAYLFKKTSPAVGASSSPSLSIQEIRLHQQFTAIKFKVSNPLSYAADYTLHPPGADYAFQLQDMQGRTYNLIDEFGYGGFGKLSLDANEEGVFTCYFQPLPTNTKSINIKEGSCKGTNCWNFYDVSLQ
jgi:hypothetical protein